MLGVANRCLHHVAGRHATDAVSSLTISRAGFAALSTDGWAGLEQQIEAGTASLDGDASLVRRVLDAIEIPNIGFAIIEP